MLIRYYLGLVVIAAFAGYLSMAILGLVQEMFDHAQQQIAVVVREGR